MAVRTAVVAFSLGAARKARDSSCGGGASGMGWSKGSIMVSWLHTGGAFPYSFDIDGGSSSA